MGGFNPSPQKFGAEKGHIEEILLDDLLEADGSALSKEPDSYVYAERLAESRCVAYLWHLSRRLANQWDPDRMTDFLPRWERIYGITPLPGDTDNDRRAKVKAKVQAAGLPPTEQVVNDLMTAVLGPSVYLGIVNTSSAQEVVWVGVTSANAAYGYAGGGVTVPGGVAIPDGTSLGLTWYSTIAHVDILVTQPASMDAATFQQTVGQVHLYLDDLLPAWVAADWIEDAHGTPGFFLDEPNLNIERFSH